MELCQRAEGPHSSASCHAVPAVCVCSQAEQPHHPCEALGPPWSGFASLHGLCLRPTECPLSSSFPSTSIHGMSTSSTILRADAYGDVPVGVLGVPLGCCLEELRLHALHPVGASRDDKRSRVITGGAVADLHVLEHDRGEQEKERKGTDWFSSAFWATSFLTALHLLGCSLTHSRALSTHSRQKLRTQT